MTITHQTLVDESGKPTAALIPWDQFEKLRELAAQESGENISSESTEEVNYIDKETFDSAADEVFDHYAPLLKKLAE